MPKSIKKAGPRKPSPDFPLFPHASGRWAKKVRQKLIYFGKTEGDEKGQAALARWLDQKDDLLAGRKPRAKGGELTVGDLCNVFLTSKSRLVQSGELSQRSLRQYHDTCALIVAYFGRNRVVTDLTAADFEELRAGFAKGRGPVALGNLITVARMLFKYGWDQGIVDHPPRYGQSFNKPSRKTLRVARAAKGLRMFEAADLRKILEAAGTPMRAFVLLGLNCGYGATDIANLSLMAIDLSGGWIDYPRPKTGIPRRCPLWHETIAAVEAAIAMRPEPKDPEDERLAFLTVYGRRWVRTNRVTDHGATPDDAIGKEFIKLLTALKLKRSGLGFYALRHTFRTVADECGDQTATNFIMGHHDASMAAMYRERISDERLRTVVEHVRNWLFGTGETEADESDETNDQVRQP
jgi:integrase